MKPKEISISVISAFSIGAMSYLSSGVWWSILSMLLGIPIYFGVETLFKRQIKWLSENIDIYFDNGIWLNTDYSNRTITIRFEMRNHTKVYFKSQIGKLSLFMGERATDEKLIGEKVIEIDKMGATFNDLAGKQKGQKDPIACFTFPVKPENFNHNIWRATGIIIFQTKHGEVPKKIDEVIAHDLSFYGVKVNTTDGVKNGKT